MKIWLIPLLLSTTSIACTDALTDGGTGGDGGGDTTTVTFTVRIVDATLIPETPLEAVEICAAERPDVPCATSDADGYAALTLPAKSELMLRCEGNNHGPAYMTWAIGTTDIDAGKFSLLDKTKTGLLLTLAGAESWPQSGAITVNVYEDLVKRDERVADATFAITPVGGGGPVYVSEAKLPAPTLSASTPGGPGVFFDLPDGEVTVSISHPTRTCTGGFGWPTATTTELRSKIFAGGLSNVTFVCPP